jgi:hypothetical protein
VNNKNAYVLTTKDGPEVYIEKLHESAPQAFKEPINTPEGVITVEGVLLAEKINGYPVIRDVMMDNTRPAGNTEIKSLQMAEIGPGKALPT